MPSFSTEMQYAAGTETQYAAGSETQSIVSTKVQNITLLHTLRGHTNWVYGVVHLHAERQIITCSTDGSLRLWDLESGTQIGEDWRDEEYEVGVRSMALSPNGKTIASGCNDGKVRLWDVKTRKVVAKWTGHSRVVGALCWSTDGKRVLSGSWDGTARVWDVKSSQTILTIKTGGTRVNAMIYSPDAEKIATGRDRAVEIWDAKTGKLLNTLSHVHEFMHMVRSLAWTSDGKKLISGSYSIRIYDTTTWQEIANLGGPAFLVNAITLSQNNRLLCASNDNTVRLWNLDKNFPVEPLLRREGRVNCAALSADGKLLVTGCQNKNAYVWDIQAILKEAGLEDLLRPSSPSSDVTAQESLMDVDATQTMDDELSPDFFNDAISGANSSRTYGNYHRFSSRRPRPLASSFGSVNTPFGRLSLFFRRSQSNTEPQQRSRRALLSRGPRIVEVAAVKDREVIFTAPPPPEKTQQQTRSHPRPFTTQPAPGANSTTPRPRCAHSLPVRLLGHLVLFLCCASPQHADANAQPTQQQGKSTGQAQPQVSSLQTQSTAASTSTTPAPVTSPTAPSAVSA